MIGWCVVQQRKRIVSIVVAFWGTTRMTDLVFPADVVEDPSHAILVNRSNVENVSTPADGFEPLPAELLDVTQNEPVSNAGVRPPSVRGV